MSADARLGDDDTNDTDVINDIADVDDINEIAYVHDTNDTEYIDDINDIRPKITTDICQVITERKTEIASG